MYVWQTLQRGIQKIEKKEYKKRNRARILRYFNYDMAEKITEYKREMITLYIPFRCENIEITDHMKYIQLYEEKQEAILRKIEEYQRIDIDKHIEEYKRLCEDLQEEREEIDAKKEHNVQKIATTIVNNDDINNIDFGNMRAVVRERTEIMSAEEFCEKMRKTNSEQRNFLLTLLKYIDNRK